MIPLKDCKQGFLYKINSRNLAFGVFNEKVDGFVGIRTKFGVRYLFIEFHYETGAPFGTVRPEKELELCPILDLKEGASDGEFFKTNKELFDWLEEKENLYKDLNNE